MANGSISQFAVVTGASSGVGLELARQFAQHGFDLLICAGNPEIKQAADELRREGHRVETLRVDLASYDGVELLCDAIRRDARSVDAFVVNAAITPNGPFIETDLAKELNLIQVNVTSIVHLTKRILPAMLARNEGRILFTSSIVGAAPRPFEAVYAASKAFVQSFVLALRNELKDTNIAITALESGDTHTLFVERAESKEQLTVDGSNGRRKNAAAEQHRTQAKSDSAQL